MAPLIFLLFSMLLAVPGAEPKGWRGIVPLHSTRAEVERLLGPPTEQKSEFFVVYRAENETVIIYYARGLPCCVGRKYRQWRVSTGTVAGRVNTPMIGWALCACSS